jgi:citrate lyase subunit beta / citryl-CoA lyase
VIDQTLANADGIALIPQIESTRGLVNVAALAAASPVGGLALGGEDFCVDLGVARSEHSTELFMPRALVALHATARGVAALDTVYTAIADEAGLIREAALARQVGFTGKLLIHPSQVAPVRRVFAPSSEQVEWARRVLASDGQEGEAGVRVVDGRMVDAPVVAQAERILARAS